MPVAVAIWLLARARLLRRERAKAAASDAAAASDKSAAASDAGSAGGGAAPSKGDDAHTWDAVNTITVPLFSTLAGVVAGAFGLGGAVVQMPLLVALGFAPQVAVATVMLCLLVTTASGVAVYGMAGLIPWDYAGVGGSRPGGLGEGRAARTPHGAAWGAGGSCRLGVPLPCTPPAVALRRLVQGGVGARVKGPERSVTSRICLHGAHMNRVRPSRSSARPRLAAGPHQVLMAISFVTFVSGQVRPRAGVRGAARGCPRHCRGPASPPLPASLKPPPAPKPPRTQPPKQTALDRLRNPPNRRESVSDRICHGGLLFLRRRPRGGHHR